MSRFHCWTGFGIYNDTGRLVTAPDEQAAAESYARQVADIDEGYEEDDQDRVEVSVVPEERPHKAPRHWEVTVKYESYSGSYTEHARTPTDFALAKGRGEVDA